MTEEQNENYDKAMDFVNKLNGLKTRSIKVIEREMGVHIRRNWLESWRQKASIFEIVEPVYGYKLWVYNLYFRNGYLGTEI